MKTYLITYLKTEVFNVPKYRYDMTEFTSYGLVENKEVVKTNDIKSAVEKIKKQALSFKSGIFPNLKADFEIKDIKPL